MENIYKMMNSINDEISLMDDSETDYKKGHKNLRESYYISTGRGQKKVPADSLDSAISMINDGMKNRKSETFVLYDDNNELIWIDRYAERDGNDLGYSVSRQSDKSIKFDKNKGLYKTESKQDSKWKQMIVNEISNNMKKYSMAAKFNKFNYVEDATTPSHIDISNNTVYCNPEESLSEIASKLVSEVEGKKEELTELFGLGKKEKIACRLGISATVSQYFDTGKILRSIRDILNRFKAEKIRVHSGVTTCDKLNYFAGTMGYIIEFVCLPKNYDKIERLIESLNGLNHATMKGRQEYTSSELNDLLPSMFKFSTTTVTESLDNNSNLLTDDKDDDVTDLVERYYDDEAPLGRGEQYPDARSKTIT